jgi:hypothetical protein
MRGRKRCSKKPNIKSRKYANWQEYELAKNLHGGDRKSEEYRENQIPQNEGK